MTDHTAVDVRKSEQDNLTRAYGLELKFLHPWQGLTAPFEGAWCVLRPGDKSNPHAHHEREIFIGMAGRGAVVTAEGRHEFVAGDIVYLRPGIGHRVVNEHDEDFTYYAIWWDRAMSDQFLDQAGPDLPE